MIITSGFLTGVVGHIGHRVEQPTYIQSTSQPRSNNCGSYSLIDAMTAVRSHNGTAVGLCMLLNDISNISVLHSWPNCRRAD